MNKYEKGQQIPISGIITITGVQQNKSGNFVYSTDRGCTIPELLIERLEMKPYGTPYYSAEPVPQQEDKPKRKFKAGDKVEIISTADGCRGAEGELGTITNLLNSNGLLNHEPGMNVKLKDGSVWRINLDAKLEPYTEPEQEPVKLYCVKDFPAYYGTSVRAGDICTFLDSDGAVRLPNGSPAGSLIPERTYKDWAKDNPERADCLVPLVKRPAKVGETILIITNDVHGANKGEIVSTGNSENFVDNAGFVWNIGASYLQGDYLVLDGYQPEPEYYNGEVVCTESTGMYHTVGKVYEVKDGYINDDKGGAPFNDGELFKTLKEFNDRQPDKFIPYKGKSDK